MSNSSLAFKPWCPAGGRWYACGNGAKFVGCCTTDPCNDNGCSQGNLRSASFLASAYGTFPDQQCSGGQWYVCKATDPPFLGCCSVNGCLDGCESQYLRAGFLSNDPIQANAFDPVPPLPSVSSSTTSISTPSSTQMTNSVSRKSTPAGTIAASVIGPTSGLILLILAVWLFLRRRQQLAQDSAPQSPRVTGNNEVSLSYPDYNPHLKDEKQPPSYASDPYSIGRSSNIYSRAHTQEIHEAGSREVSYARSPPQSPVATSDAMSGGYSAFGSGARNLQGHGENEPAELDGRTNERP